MSDTNFSGLSVAGTPISGGVYPYFGAQGKVFFVCSSAAKYAYTHALYPPVKGVTRVFLQDATHNGIQSAIDACRDGYGDVIMVEPGYFLVTTQIVLNKNRVSIIARKPGRRNTVLFGGSASYGAWTSDLLKITAGYFNIVGLSFYSYSTTNSAILCDDAGGGGDYGGFGQFIDCTFPPEGGGVGSEKYGVDVKGANNIDFINCEFIGQLSGGIRFRGGVGNPINPLVKECRFIGCVSGIEVASAVYNGVMDDCFVGTATYPAGMSITQGILSNGGGGEWAIRKCHGSLTAANFVQGIGITTIGDTSGGYTQLT